MGIGSTPVSDVENLQLVIGNLQFLEPALLTFKLPITNCQSQMKREATYRLPLSLHLPGFGRLGGRMRSAPT
jgi:hypothetical protein